MSERIKIPSGRNCQFRISSLIPDAPPESFRARPGPIESPSPFDNQDERFEEFYGRRQKPRFTPDTGELGGFGMEGQKREKR